MFFKNLIRRMGVFCIMGFVVGVLFGFVMPPIVIAIVEGILLIAVCICLVCP